jgi:hypothetical protein
MELLSVQPEDGALLLLTPIHGIAGFSPAITSDQSGVWKTENP